MGETDLFGIRTDKYVSQGAVISKDERYRYFLWREWRGSATDDNWEWLDAVDGNGVRLGEPKAVTFIMLNPSTADAQEDDPTIRRCVGFAKAWKYDRINVVNIFGHRATDPDALLALDHNDDPVGPDNQKYIDHAVSQSGIIICAWGKHGRHLGQDLTTMGWLWKPAHCLGRNKDMSPKHPLYLPANSERIPFS